MGLNAPDAEDMQDLPEENPGLSEKISRLHNAVEQLKNNQITGDEFNKKLGEVFESCQTQEEFLQLNKEVPERIFIDRGDWQQEVIIGRLAYYNQFNQPVRGITGWTEKK